MIKFNKNTSLKCDLKIDIILENKCNLSLVNKINTLITQLESINKNLENTQIQKMTLEFDL